MILRTICTCALLLFAISPGEQSPSAATPDAPTYASDGNLLAPSHYREWVYLTTGIDMSYTSANSAPGQSLFDNVFVNPTAYRSFLKTGTWPDKTMLVLEVRAAENPTSINKRGHTQSSNVVGMEIHLRDNGQWKFYDLSDGGATAKLIPRPASCYTCHEAHGAVDTTFVQFYPTLLPLAMAQHTLSATYLKDSRNNAAPSTTRGSR